MGAACKLDTAAEYAQRVGGAIKQGRHTVSALRCMSQHPALFLDEFSGLNEAEVAEDSTRLHASAARLVKLCGASFQQITKEAERLNKKEPNRSMTFFGKQTIAWLLGIAHCAHNAPNGTLKQYADDLRIALHPLGEETAVNNAFALLLESNIDL